jgi:hypothetical protein
MSVEELSETESHSKETGKQSTKRMNEHSGSLMYKKIKPPLYTGGKEQIILDKTSHDFGIAMLRDQVSKSHCASGKFSRGL